MKFSNGVHADPERLKRQGTVSVAWQSVVLDEVAAPSLADRDLPQRDDQGGSPLQVGADVGSWSRQSVQGDVEMALAVKDDLIGVPMAANGVGQSAHAITLHSQPLEAAQMGSGLALASDSINEVVNIYLQQAEAYCDESQWEKAFEACQEALKVAPATAEAYKFLGKILQQQGRPTDAMGFYAKAITIRPNFPEVYCNLGSLYAQKGKWEEAVSYYKKAIEREPELAIAYLNLAKIWKRLDRKESELNCRATALRLQPDLGDAQEHFQLAQVLESAGNREGAVLFYRQAVAQDSKMVAAYQRLADLLEEGGDWQGAAECYRQVLSLKAEAEKASVAERSAAALPVKLSPEGQQQLQQLMQVSKSKKLLIKPESESTAGHLSAESETAAVSQLALSAAEAATLSPTELAQRYADAEDWPRAVEQMLSAIAQEPRSARLYRNLANLFEKNNEPKRAAEAWYRSFVLEPSWPDAQQCFTLGRVLARHGNSQAAIRCYQQSVQLEPEFLPAREALDSLLSSSVGDASLAQENVAARSGLPQTETIPIKK